MEELAVMVYVQWMMLKERFVEGVHHFLTDERGDVNIVSIVVLIGVAVLLAVVFKEQAKGLIENLFGQIGGTATDAINN